MCVRACSCVCMCVSGGGGCFRASAGLRYVLDVFPKDATHLLDFSLHNAEGFVTGGHRTVLCSTSSLLCHAVLPWCQGVPAADCLILPDFSETDINNLFALLYDDGHRFSIIGKSRLRWT